MNTTDITAWLALLLSLAGLYWQWNDKRPRLNISPRVVTRPLPSLSDGSGGGLSKSVPVLSIYLSNPGEKPIHIKGVRLAPNKGREFQVFEYNALYTQLSQPVTIDPLRGYDFVVYGQQLAENLKAEGYTGEVRVTIKVYDELNKQYKSKLVRLSVTQLLRVEQV